MGKQGHKREKNTAIRDNMLKEYENQLSQMSDEKFSDLAMTIPPKHPMMPVVYAEHQKRSRRQWQELMDSAPSPEMRELAEDIRKPETFERFLHETGNRESFKQLCEGDEEAFEQIVNGLSEQTGRMN